MKIMILLFVTPFGEFLGRSDMFENFFKIVFFLAIPLAWVIPIIIRSYRRKPIDDKRENMMMNDKLNQLERLAKLKEQGAISQEEFSEQKARILGKDPEKKY